MRNMLLDIDVSLIIGLILLVGAIVAGVIFAIRLNKQMANTSRKIDWNTFNAKGQLKKHVPVLWPKELEFYYMFRSVLPREYMIIPKMGVDEIIKPNGASLILFNAVKSEHIDFCVVKVSNMEPIAVIDTYYPSITDSTIQEIDLPVKKALESVGIPVIKYEIQDVPYNKEMVLKKFLDEIDPVSLAELRKKK